MSSMHDAGEGSSGFGGSYVADGIQSHSHRMSLRASGWESPIGWINELSVERVVHRRPDDEGKALTWDCLRTPELKLSKAAALLRVQGLPLNHLFPPDLTFCMGDGMQSVLSYSAPILLLQRTVPSPVEGPKLKNVVLGVVTSAMGYSEEEIRSLMLAHVLSP